MKEERRFIRFGIALKVKYTIQKEPKTEKIGTTKDICAEGMQLLTQDKMEIGNKLDLKILIPQALNPVHMRGVIVWSREISTGEQSSYGTGIGFDKIEEDNKNTFLKFLCSLMYEKTGRTRP